MAALAQATQIRNSEGRLYAELDSEWSIWGPIGGYVAAIALRGVGMIVPEGHRPVTFTCQYLARGEIAPAEVRVQTVKTGSTACHNVTLVQGEKVFLQAQVWTTAKTEGPARTDLTMPDVPAPDTLKSVADQLRSYGYDPARVWELIDGRQVDFREPGNPDPRGCRTERWLRFEDWAETDDPFLDAARALVGIDIHIWPAHNRGVAQIPSYVAPSLDLTVWFHSAAPKSSWQLVEARSDIMGDALLSGTARLWSSDGKLIASGGSQCLVLPLKSGA